MDTPHQPPPPGGFMHCDCGANPDEIHDPACMTRQGEPDDASDHYDQ